VLSQHQCLSHSGRQKGFHKSCPMQAPAMHLSQGMRHSADPEPEAQLPSPPMLEETPVSWAVTAVFEVALDSCRCTCADSRGLCGTGQTAPCSLGNSVMSQQCCKAESKRKQVRDTCHPAAATHPKVATLPGLGYGPWLDQLC